MLARGLQTLSLERESNTVSWCVRPWIKFTPEYPFNLYCVAYLKSLAPISSEVVEQIQLRIEDAQF